MDNPPKHLRVFVSSPGDVSAERALAFQLLERIPYDPLLRGRTTLETVAWDMPGGGAPMLATVTPQEAIDRELPKPSQCDIVVVILWARIGTPLPDASKPDGTPYLSGTEWEYEDALRSDTKPPILVYRRTTLTKFEPGDPETEQKLAQWKSVEEFFRRFHNLDGSARGGYRTYETPTDFAALLDHDLRAVIKRVLDEPGEQAQIFLSVGDRLAAQKRYSEALDQYGIALRASPRNVEANRRVVSVMRDRLLLQAFGPGSSIGIALRHDVGGSRTSLCLAPSSEVDAALSALYRTQALTPALEEDVGLLIDEALILKVGQRFQEAVAVLRRAHALAPANTQVLAELGLLLALFSKAQPAAAEGIRLLRNALCAEPGDTRSHLSGQCARGKLPMPLCRYGLCRGRRSRGMRGSHSGIPPRCGSRRRGRHLANPRPRPGVRNGYLSSIREEGRRRLGLRCRSMSVCGSFSGSHPKRRETSLAFTMIQHSGSSSSTAQPAVWRRLSARCGRCCSLITTDGLGRRQIIRKISVI